MAERKAIVLVAGTLSELPTGDAIAGVAPSSQGVTNGNNHAHNGGDGGQIAYSSLSGLPTLGTAAATASTDYAPAAKGVTNGDSHNHNGGDGAQIAYSSLSGTPTLGTAAAMTGPSGTIVGTTDTQTLTNKTLTGLRETKTAPSISAGTLTLDCAAGNVFAVALNANITTLAFSNVPASGTAYGCTVEFTADGTPRTITWGSSVKWPGGTALTLTASNGKVDRVVLTTHDGGTTWYAANAGQNY